MTTTRKICTSKQCFRLSHYNFITTFFTLAPQDKWQLPLFTLLAPCPSSILIRLYLFSGLIHANISWEHLIIIFNMCMYLWPFPTGGREEQNKRVHELDNILYRIQYMTCVSYHQ